MGNVRGAQLPELCPPLWRGVRAVEIRCTRGERSFEKRWWTREIRSISHRENTLADVLVSENGVSLTNITEIGKRRVIVYPDGATSTVESRWDRGRVGGDGRVELVGDQTVVGERFFDYSEND